jgi:hypothetical protein
MRVALYIISFLIVTTAQAQDAKNFLVFRIKGSGYYSRDKYKIPLKIGTSLSPSDQVTLSKRSEVMVICNNYSLFTISNQNGNAQIFSNLKKYNDSCGTLKTNVSLNFLKYIWKQLHEESLAIDDSHAENLKEVGAVVRGCADMAFSKIRDTISVYKIPFSIKYNNPDTSSRFEFALYDDENAVAPFYKTIIFDNQISLKNTVIKLLQPDNTYYWTVLRNGGAICDKKILNKVGDDKYKKILAAIKQKDFQLLSQQDQYKVLSFLLAKNNLVAEAYKYIKVANKPGKGDVFLNVLKQDLGGEFVF